MTTKRSSDPVTNCSQHLRNQGKEPCMEEGGSNRIKETFCSWGQQGNLCEPSQQSYQWFFVQKDCHSYSRKEMDYYLTLTLHGEDICLHRYPRWSQRWFVITIKTNEKKMDHVIGIPWDRCCWRRFVLDGVEEFYWQFLGFSWFSKAAARKERSNTAWMTNPFLSTSDSGTLRWYSDKTRKRVGYTIIP